MAIDAARKKEYNDLIRDQKAKIDDLEKDIKMMKRGILEDKKLKPYLHIGCAAKLLEQAHLYMDMNETSERMLEIKNNGFLDSARKNVYKIISELTEVVTLEVDEPLDFNRDQLDSIKLFNPKQRMNLNKHNKKLIERLIKAYGENTKWKWSFPEMNGKMVVLAKNFMDFREIQAIRDPREEFYYDRREFLDTIKEDLLDASNQYRNKFELSTKSNNDLLYAVYLLESLRRIASLIGDPELVKKAKSGVESYRSRMEADEKEKQKGVTAKK